MKKYKHCYACPSHNIINDSDPCDSFCMDDCAVVCKEIKVDGRKIAGAKRRQSPYKADYSEFKVVSCALRPYQISKVEAPKWCPRKALS